MIDRSLRPPGELDCPVHRRVPRPTRRQVVGADRQRHSRLVGFAVDLEFGIAGNSGQVDFAHRHAFEFESDFRVPAGQHLDGLGLALAAVNPRRDLEGSRGMGRQHHRRHVVDVPAVHGDSGTPGIGYDFQAPRRRREVDMDVDPVASQCSDPAGEGVVEPVLHPNDHLPGQHPLVAKRRISNGLAVDEYPCPVRRRSEVQCRRTQNELRQNTARVPVGRCDDDHEGANQAPTQHFAMGFP